MYLFYPLQGRKKLFSTEISPSPQEDFDYDPLSHFKSHSPFKFENSIQKPEFIINLRKGSPYHQKMPYEPLELMDHEFNNPRKKFNDKRMENITNYNTKLKETRGEVKENLFLKSLKKKNFHIKKTQMNPSTLSIPNNDHNKFNIDDITQNRNDNIECNNQFSRSKTDDYKCITTETGNLTDRNLVKAAYSKCFKDSLKSQLHSPSSILKSSVKNNISNILPAFNYN